MKQLKPLALLLLNLCLMTTHSSAQQYIQLKNDSIYPFSKYSFYGDKLFFSSPESAANLDSHFEPVYDQEVYVEEVDHLFDSEKGTTLLLVKRPTNNIKSQEKEFVYDFWSPTLINKQFRAFVAEDCYGNNLCGNILYFGSSDSLTVNEIGARGSIVSTKKLEGKRKLLSEYLKSDTVLSKKVLTPNFNGSINYVGPIVNKLFYKNYIQAEKPENDASIKIFTQYDISEEVMIMVNHEVYYIGSQSWIEIDVPSMYSVPYFISTKGADKIMEEYNNSIEAEQYPYFQIGDPRGVSRKKSNANLNTSLAADPVVSPHKNKSNLMLHANSNFSNYFEIVKSNQSSPDYPHYKLVPVKSKKGENLIVKRKIREFKNADSLDRKAVAILFADQKRLPKGKVTVNGEEHDIRSDIQIRVNLDAFKFNDIEFKGPSPSKYGIFGNVKVVQYFQIIFDRQKSGIQKHFELKPVSVNQAAEVLYGTK